MDAKHVVNAIAADDMMSPCNEQANVESLLEEIKQKQIILNQQKLILSAVKEAAIDPSLDESVKDTVNRVLVHEAFVNKGLPKNVLSQSVIEKNAAAKLSYSESAPLREMVEKILTKRCKEVMNNLDSQEKALTTEYDANNEKLEMFLQCESELKKADRLLFEEQELFASLVDLRKKSLEDLQSSAQDLSGHNLLLGLKSKVAALTFEKETLKDDMDLPQSAIKLRAHWKNESEKSEAAVKKAEQDRDEYARLEKNDTYMLLLKEYLRVLQQTECLETALGKL